MKKFRNIISVVFSMLLFFTVAGKTFADSTGEVITLGANLNKKQKQEILGYFGVSESNPNIIYINNAQERKYLGGIAPERQIGRVTMSSSYVIPTTEGGINVKTSNITWVTSSMIASTLATAGVENANVVAAAPFPVSGTGALTGIMIGFEKSSGQSLGETKKKLANQELVTTGNLADKIGKDKAAGIVNDAKKEVIKEKLKNPEEIRNAVTQAANNYNVNLTTGDVNILVNLMQNIGNQNYDYNQIKDTLDKVSVGLKSKLKESGEKVDFNGLLDKASSWFNSNKDAQKFFNQFDDSKLSKNAVVNNTLSGLESAKKTVGNIGNEVNKSGFFQQIIEFFKSLFN